MTLNHNFGYFSGVGSGIAGNIKLYSIEQIKSAIIKENDNCGQPLTDKSIKAIINNLTK